MEVATLYHTEFVRNARAVGVLWAVCTLCLSIIQVVVLIQPSWVGSAHRGSLGLFEVCLDSSQLLPECRGSLSTLTPLPAFHSAAVCVCVAVCVCWCSMLCVALFRFCNAAAVYKTCGWLQLTSGVSLALACLLFPDSWDNKDMKALCGDTATSFSPGRCSVHWAFILALLGVLDTGILATLAFVLASRQDALLPPGNTDGSAGLLMAA